jgi:Hint module
VKVRGETMSIPIHELKIGDYVQVGSKEDGSDIMFFSQVYSLGHYNDALENEFIQLHYYSTPSMDDPNNNNNMPLEISADHLLFVQKQPKSRNRMVPIPASNVRVGDVLSNGNVIQSIQYVTRQGVYAPMTYSGDLIVNHNIRVSNHVKLMSSNLIGWDQHRIGQIATFPRRFFCSLYLDHCKQETYTVDGYAVWISWIIQISTMINQGGSIAALLLTMLSTPYIAWIYIMDNFCGVFFSMTFLLVTIGMVRRTTWKGTR